MIEENVAFWFCVYCTLVGAIGGYLSHVLVMAIKDTKKTLKELRDALS